MLFQRGGAGGFGWFGSDSHRRADDGREAAPWWKPDVTSHLICPACFQTNPKWNKKKKFTPPTPPSPFTGFLKILDQFLDQDVTQILQPQQWLTGVFSHMRAASFPLRSVNIERCQSFSAAQVCLLMKMRSDEEWRGAMKTGSCCHLVAARWKTWQWLETQLWIFF